MLLLVTFQASDEWVLRLGAEEYAAREEATEALLRIGVPARKAVADGCASSDPEVATRCLLLMRRLDFTIEPGMTIDIEVVGEEELSLRALFVPPDGYDYLPYIGRVRLAGKTRDELREDLEARYGRILKGPQVFVRWRGTDTLPWNPPF